jgi:hypothetical protein
MVDPFGRRGQGRQRSVEHGYDVAQVCLEGHMVNSSVQNYPQHNRDHCPQCGEKTITSCPNCNVPIQGHYYVPGVASMSTEAAPLHCHGCGHPFPWTVRKKEAAIELFLEESGYQGEDAEEFKKNVDDIVRNTSRATVAANRIKKGATRLTATLA